MKYVPFNRHLLLEECERDEETSVSQVLVPDDYKVVKDFGTYRIVAKSSDCATVFSLGARVVVEESMVRKVPTEEGDKFITSQNYVLLYEQM